MAAEKTAKKFRRLLFSCTLYICISVCNFYTAYDGFFLAAHYKHVMLVMM